MGRDKVLRYAGQSECLARPSADPTLVSANDLCPHPSLYPWCPILSFTLPTEVHTEFGPAGSGLQLMLPFILFLPLDNPGTLNSSHFFKDSMACVSSPTKGSSGGEEMAEKEEFSDSV